MPNWCQNSVKIYHSNLEMMERFVNAYKKGTVLQEFIPVPESLIDTVSGFVPEKEGASQLEKEKINMEAHGYKNWYDFCVNEWGTKWDISPQDELQVIHTHHFDGHLDNYRETIKEDGIHINFDSAWSPPLSAYNKLTDMGFYIKAMYYEPSMGFAGVWEDKEELYFDSIYHAKIESTLPKELDECFGISEELERTD